MQKDTVRTASFRIQRAGRSGDPGQPRAMAVHSETLCTLARQRAKTFAEHAFESVGLLWRRGKVGSGRSGVDRSGEAMRGDGWADDLSLGTLIDGVVALALTFAIA